MIIEVDEYKKLLPEYDPNRSEDFHIESSKLADKEFTKCLKSGKYRNVVLMSGGTASGKTEFANEYLSRKNILVYDGTLKDYDGYKIKMQRITRYGKSIKSIKVVLIIPIDKVKAFAAFLGRERKMKPEVFFDTQLKSKLVVYKILRESKTKVEIYFSNSDTTNQKLSYKKLNMRIGRKKVAKLLEAMV